MKRKSHLTVVVLLILLAVTFSACGDAKDTDADPTQKATPTPSVVTSTPAPATEAPATAAEPTFATTERYVICDVLNVRSEPVFSGSENLIGSLYYGDPIDVVETGEDYFKILWFEDGYDFAYVNSGVAYTSEQEPDKIETAPLSTADPNGPTTTMWILSVTRVRSEPRFVGTDNIICELPAGETIEVLEEGSSYYVIKCPDAEGQLAYITNDPTLVSRTDPNAATPDPEAPAT